MIHKKKAVEAQNSIILSINDFSKMIRSINQNVQIDLNFEIDKIKKLLLILIKVKFFNYILIIEKISLIFDNLNRLKNSDNSTLTIKNQLSSLFLKLMIKIFDCQTLNNSKIHKIFKILINCYILNFKFFTKSDRFQLNLLFQFISDLILINFKIINPNLNHSYIKRIKNHKIKNQLTIFSNGYNLQILLYYLIQLLFLIIKIKKEENPKKFIDKFYIQNKLKDLLAFLILNKNPDLIRIYQRNFKIIFN